jgi:hypothetical protein
MEPASDSFVYHGESYTGVSWATIALGADPFGLEKLAGALSVPSSSQHVPTAEPTADAQPAAAQLLELNLNEQETDEQFIAVKLEDADEDDADDEAVDADVAKTVMPVSEHPFFKSASSSCAKAPDDTPGRSMLFPHQRAPKPEDEQYDDEGTREDNEEYVWDEEAHKYARNHKPGRKKRWRRNKMLQQEADDAAWQPTEEQQDWFGDDDDCGGGDAQFWAVPRRNYNMSVLSVKEVRNCNWCKHDTYERRFCRPRRVTRDALTANMLGTVVNSCEQL